MHCVYLLLLTVTCLVYTTNCVLYYVVPDDHYLDTDYGNNTLQHYLNNSEKYFTSHTQIVFLPGKHQLHTDLVIQDVQNLTLQGNVPSEMNNTIIYCVRSAHVLINSSDDITITHLMVNECGISQGKELPLVTLQSYNCSHIMLLNSMFVCQYQQCGLAVANVVGDSYLTNITSSYLLITHNMTRSNSDMMIWNYNHMGHTSYKYRAVEILLYEHFYIVKLFIVQIQLSLNKAMNISCLTTRGTNEMYIIKMELTGITKAENIIAVTIITSGIGSAMINMIYFEDCLFTNINSQPGSGLLFEITANYGLVPANFYFFRCIFSNINSTSIIRTYSYQAGLQDTYHAKLLLLIIDNSSFVMLKDAVSVLLIENTQLILLGPVVFTKITNCVAIIHSVNSYLVIRDHITISLNQAHFCLIFHYIQLKEQAKLDIIANNFSVVFYVDNEFDSLCLFQYEVEGLTASQPQYLLKNSMAVMLQGNIGDKVTNKRYPMSHCEWIGQPMFPQLDPFEVNKKIVHYVNNSMAVQPSVPNTICYCTDDQHYNCSTDELGPVYPGQTLHLKLLVNVDRTSEHAIEILVNNEYRRACKSHIVKDHIFLIPGICTKIEYKSILDSDGKSCYIHLSGLADIHTFPSSVLLSHIYIKDVYRITISPCPLAFALNKILLICQCDPVLKPVGLSAESCNIDDQTILRPAGSWIMGRINTDNNYTYQVSSHCPFDYCLPHSSHLNLSNPDYQCQFNRTGVLCGRCEQGLSTVFGTSQCKQCPNYYLFLVLPFILVGISVIMLLFISNFTVVDGNINGLIFYANIVSINGSVFFPSYESTKHAYVLISFLNLDLGIEVCFYNGMDDYAKMWLELIFPIYLIFIATLLILTSRYSSGIQRITARRALPVLATLFLLSYTKILRTVSSVLFSYSTITSLPSQNTTLVWSVDTEVQLFGVKFTALFIVCLVLFLILLPFNTVLIFTRTLSQFKCINQFKPLLDAYQGPYKDRFYYWTGLQLLLRAVFYGISALDRNTNMMIGILMLGAVGFNFGFYCPFKSNSRNFQELLLVLNLHTLFTASWYTTSNSIAVNTLVGIAVVQFIIFSLYQTQLWSKIKNHLTKTLAHLAPERCFNYFKPQVPPATNGMELKTIVPEVSFNYKEFQEPLIGHDK